MKKAAWKTVVLAIGFALALIAGCGEKDAPSVKQSRVIAAENMELQKELDRSRARFDNMKEQCDKELEKQRDLIERYKKERDEWKAKSQRNVRDQAMSVVDPLMEEITRLREENRKLTAQLEEPKE